MSSVEEATEIAAAEVWARIDSLLALLRPARRSDTLRCRWVPDPRGGPRRICVWEPAADPSDSRTV